jgi:decaprenylphospho-beta-D-ribofuranose 2-oxidase
MHFDNNFTSFGNSDTVKSKLCAPDRIRKIEKFSNTVIPYGGGYSYNDISFFRKSVSISSKKFNRILEFNEQEGYIEIESGTSLQDIFFFLKKKNFYLKVQPGFPLITIGGCIAGNVHGKNQFKDGNFNKIIRSIRLFNPDKGIIELSEYKNKKLFDLTIGGLGLTGFIISAKIKIHRLEASTVQNKKVFFKSIDEAFNILKNEAPKNDFLYSWHQTSISSNFKGFVNLGNFKKNKRNTSSKKKSLRNFKKRLSFFTFYNNATVMLIQKIFYYKSYLFKTTTSSLYNSFFPLASKWLYFYFYGKAGLIESQFIIPEKIKEDFINYFESQVKKNRPTIVLLSIKYFKNDNYKYLRFDDSGYCISINLPNNTKNRLFLNYMYSFLKNNKCKVNLTKDSYFKHKNLNYHFPDSKKFFQSLDDYKKTSKQFLSKLNFK